MHKCRHTYWKRPELLRETLILMIKRNIKILFCSRSETNLASELNLLDYLQRYNNGLLNNVDTKLLEDQVNYVYENEPNVNTYREEQIGEIFNIQNYSDQSILLELIYFLVGKKHNEDIEPITFEKLDKWGDCVMQHGFYLGYELKKDDICRLLKELQLDYILRYSRDVDLRGREWERLCKDDFNEQLDEDDIIAKINLYNDGAYTALPESVDTLLFYINKNQDWKNWLELYNLLTYVPLQGTLIYSIKTIEDCIEIIKAESRDNVHYRKVFAYLMRKRIFDLFVQEQDLLERNANNGNLNDEKKNLAALILREWNESKHEFVSQIVNLHWKIFFSADEMIVWMSDKYSHMQSMKGIYKKRHSETLQLIERVIFDIYNYFNGITIEDKKLSVLLYYISHIEITEKGKCNQIIDSICKKIYTEEHLYLPWQLDEESLNIMRAVYKCLDCSELNGKIISEQYISQINKDGNSIRTHQGNKWWLSVLMLKIEESACYEEFMNYAEILFDGAKKSSFLLQENYLLPFIIAEIITIEVVNKAKNIFEKRLIHEIDDIIFILSILTANNGDISNENKSLLKEKVQKTWEEAKRNNRFNRNIEICEKYLKNNRLI